MRRVAVIFWGSVFVGTLFVVGLGRGGDINRIWVAAVAYNFGDVAVGAA